MAIQQKISGIYVIRNRVNNKLYLGSSNNIRVRKYNHLYKLRKGKHHSILLQRAWNKYGEDNFDFSIILRCESIELLRYEQLLIDLMRPEYNIASDAKAPTRGKILKKEHKNKISVALMGHPNHLIKHSEETKEKIRKSMLGRKMTDEQRKAVSIRMLGNKNGLGNKGGYRWGYKQRSNNPI